MERSIRLYRLLLKLYPREFRFEYEEPLDQAFRDLARIEESRGIYGTLHLWLRVGPDFMETLMIERFKQLTMFPKNTVLNTAAILVAWLPLGVLFGVPFLVLSSVVAILLSILVVALFWLSNDRDRARCTLRYTGIFGAIYLAFLIGMLVISGPAVIQAGETYCPDILCTSVTDFQRTPAGTHATVRLQLHVWSKANRVPTSLNGYRAHLIDDQNRQFPAVPDGTSFPFHFSLKPGEATMVSLTFEVPNDAQGLHLTGDRGRTSLAGFLITGNSDFVHKVGVQFRLQR